MLRSFFNRWLLHPLYRWEIGIGIAMEFVLCVCVLNLLYRWEKVIWVVFGCLGLERSFYMHSYISIKGWSVPPLVGLSVYQ